MDSVMKKVDTGIAVTFSDAGTIAYESERPPLPASLRSIASISFRTQRPAVSTTAGLP